MKPGAQGRARVAQIVPEIAEKVPVEAPAVMAAGACACLSAGSAAPARCRSELGERQARRLVRQRRRRRRLAVAHLEMLRELVDDFGLARRLRAQRREPHADFALPVRHVRLR